MMYLGFVKSVSSLFYWLLEFVVDVVGVFEKGEL